jgi:glycine dehydrogenase subunit 1
LFSRAARLANLRGVSGYTSVTDDERREMLDEIGVSSVEELFDVPAGVRLDGPLDLPDGLSEAEVYERMRSLAARNADAESEVCFLGAGMYDHYAPAIVDAIISRSEVLTPYTPYQPEISQGGLQAMFEFQTAMTELTGLPLASAGLYEGPSSVAAAGYLAIGATKRHRFVTSLGLHPHSRETLATYAHGFGTEIAEVPLRDGVTDPEAWAAAIDADTSAVFFAQPNFYGAVEDAAALAAAAKDSPAVVVAQVDPLTLGILKPPGECGVDVAVGEGQSLGNRLDFGGPSFGFFAATEAYLRRMPGRIAGETTDVEGRRGFVLTLQTREQHIRREKATSNMTTNQTLLALAGLITLCWLGPEGLRELGETCTALAAYAKEQVGLPVAFDRPHFKEVAFRTPIPAREVVARAREHGVHPGYPLGRDYPGLDDVLLVALTEKRTPADVDRLAEVLAEVTG